MTAQTVLDFWFDEAGPSHWFTQSDAFDAKVRVQFELTAVQAAAQLEHQRAHPWQARPEGSLALIIMLDQFSRNMFRGTPAMYAWDDLALACAKRAVDSTFDLITPQERRAFFYMPFMHSENLDDQERCVYLVKRGLNNPDTLHHAQQHLRTIERFGRFPHRNAVLGRQTTPEEAAYLKSGGYTP